MQHNYDYYRERIDVDKEKYNSIQVIRSEAKLYHQRMDYEKKLLNFVDVEFTKDL